MVSVAESIASLKRKEPAPLSHRERARKFYASFAWRKLRYQVLAANAERNNGVAQCELCHAVAAPGSPLNVDHIKPLSQRWDLRLDRDNLQVLCRDCNHGKLNLSSRDWRPSGEASST